MNYLVFPRWIACVISLVCLTFISIGVTLGFAVGVAVLEYNFTVLEYVNTLRKFVGPMDLLCALVKATVFGSIIPVISCAYGFHCKGGAEGVGSATTNSVVASTLVVIVYDFILTYLFSLVF